VNEGVISWRGRRMRKEAIDRIASRKIYLVYIEE
jgi:hypothetical protein